MRAPLRHHLVLAPAIGLQCRFGSRHPPSPVKVLLGLLFGVSSRLVIRSHSRPDQVSYSQRNRMLRRQKKNFARPTGHAPRAGKQLYFLLSPADPQVDLTPGRSQRCTRSRGEMKKSRNCQELLDRFFKAQEKDMVDASVVGAAMQRCGQGRWWNTLLKIWEVQQKSGLVLHCIEHNLLLHALASCLKCKKCTDLHMNVRKEKAIQLAKTVWGSPLPTTSRDFDCALSSALKVCLRVGSTKAFRWADELWEWSERQMFQKTVVTYGARLSVCELQGRHRDVDDLFQQCTKQHVELDSVLLGDLVECAASLLDIKRADFLWETLTVHYHVQPNFLTYSVYAKAHMLAGQPQSAVKIIDDMLGARQGPMDYKLAIDYLQALLLVAHSSLSPCDLKRIRKFLPEGAGVVNGKSARSGKQNWRSLRAVSLQLLSDPQKPCFKDLLVTKIAKDSVMTGWVDHLAGTSYLE